MQERSEVERRATTDPACGFDEVRPGVALSAAAGRRSSYATKKMIIPMIIKNNMS